jgi:hypothetical protein
VWTTTEDVCAIGEDLPQPYSKFIFFHVGDLAANAFMFCIKYAIPEDS